MSKTDRLKAAPLFVPLASNYETARDYTAERPYRGRVVEDEIDDPGDPVVSAARS